MGYYSKRMWGGASGIIQDASLKLWLDASNPLSYPGTGTLWSDLSGNGNNGTMINGVAYSTANGGVMSFDGVNDYVQYPLTYANINTTISVWFKTTQSNKNNHLISLNRTNALSSTSVRVNTTNLLRFSWETQSLGSFDFLDTGVAVNDGVWHNAVAVLGTNNAHLYLDGLLVSSKSTSISNIEYQSTINTVGLNFITGDNTRFFGGQLNEPLIYNRALTPEEVNQNFQATRHKYNI